MSYIPAHQIFHAPTPAAAPAPVPTPAPTPKPALAHHIDALPDAPTDTWPETQFTRARQVEFLHALADCGQVRRASAAIGISYRTVYRERRANRAFARAWDAALLSARALGEDVLACRAIDGVEEVVWFRGEEVGRRIRFDSRLLLAHLARLDKMTEDARTRAYADDLEGALERFEAGCDDPAPLCDDCGSVLPMVTSKPHEPTPAHPKLVEGGIADDSPVVLRQAQDERTLGSVGQAQHERDWEQSGLAGGADPAPAIFSPGPCDKCDMPSAKAAAARSAAEAERARRAAPCDRCGGRCNDPAVDLNPSECRYDEDARFEAMHEARPDDAPWPEDLTTGDVWAVEYAQLAAFEAGVERWWLVVPPPADAPRGDEEDWYFADV